VVAEVVVDLLEAVQVEHEGGHPAAVVVRGQGPFGGGVERGAVRQAGEAVVGGHPLDDAAVRAVRPADRAEHHQAEHEDQQRAEAQQGGVLLGPVQAVQVRLHLPALLGQQAGADLLGGGFDVLFQNVVRALPVAHVEAGQVPHDGGAQVLVPVGQRAVADGLAGFGRGEPAQRGQGPVAGAEDGDALLAVRLVQGGLHQRLLPGGQVDRLLVAVGPGALGGHGADDRGLPPAAQHRGQGQHDEGGGERHGHPPLHRAAYRELRESSHVPAPPSRSGHKPQGSSPG
jgi:hypothetical protein